MALQKSQLTVRWLVLVLACIMMIGNYYCFDNPAALHNSMATLMPPDNFETYYSLLYTVYSIPNIILPFFGGFFVDKLGAPICLIIFSTLILAGQIVFAFGASIESWGVMLLGRVIFGLGGENLTVAQSAVLAQWFVGKELAFAFGINLSISRLGSVINNYVSPAVADDFAFSDFNGVSLALWVGALICGGSLFTAFMIVPIDKSASKRLKDSRKANDDLTTSLLEDGGKDRSKTSSFDGIRAVSAERLSTSAMLLHDEEEDEEIRLTDVKNFGVIFWLLSLSCLVVYGCVLPFNSFASGILSERNYFKAPSSSCVLEFSTQCSSGLLAVNATNNPARDDGDFSSGVSNCPGNDYAPVFPSSLDSVTCEGFSGLNCEKSSYTFTDLKSSDIDCDDDFWAKGCTKNYCDTYSSATKTADSVMSIPYFISAGMSPLLGFLVDRIGYRAIVASLAPCMLVWVHLTLGFSDGSPILPLVGQGIAYSLFAAVLWPSVPFSVEAKSVGTAYGLITAIQNFGLAVFPIIVSQLKISNDGLYLPSAEVFFTMCAAAGVIVGIFLNVFDAKRGGKLNSIDGKGRREKEERMPPTPIMST
ncbi:hypothetical protein TrLO_g4155 [Triparma laevis f. longispina]|uniref:Lysosomal dipeptide transporter MFSD1 n=1 Tax=Triparma laevis f. longispina TaxID=1714387 RepID=A0A9W7KX77_9STRA|nr:hypothetical protein TrLO_g4155 [Triparma laevis f. longispina]